MNEITFVFEIDEKSGVPFYRQIIQQVETGISTGKLKAGDKLPTIRKLAIELKINPNTIAKSYNEMELKGLVVTQVGSGTFIADIKIDIDQVERKKKMDEACSVFFATAKQLGYDYKDALVIINSYKE